MFPLENELEKEGEEGQQNVKHDAYLGNFSKYSGP